LSRPTAQTFETPGLKGALLILLLVPFGGSSFHLFLPLVLILLYPWSNSKYPFLTFTGLTFLTRLSPQAFQLLPFS